MLNEFLKHPPQTPFCVLLGDPVSHSLSPRLHNEGFRQIGSGWSYHAIRVGPEELDQLPDLFALPGFRGANVTVPHKEAVMPYLQHIDALALDIGAVNTVVATDGGPIGFNTDLDGFLDPLRPCSERLRGADALIFGSGGAQKAVRFALDQLEMATVRIVSRTPDPSNPGHIGYSDVEKFVSTTLLFVNATPLGLPHLSDRSPFDGIGFTPETHQIGYDLLYKPRITPFLKKFETNGATVIGGMEMFIGQAKRSFELWTGMAMPKEATDVLF